MTTIDTEIAKLIVTQLDERCAARTNYILQMMPGHSADTDAVLLHVKQLRTYLSNAIKQSNAQS